MYCVGLSSTRLFPHAYPVDDAVVGIVYACGVDGVEVDLGGAVGLVAHALADDGDGDVHIARNACPRVARYIEYKNKIQEKCNYCTTYQCISVFYKKNVELHLLLILAIDSVIYSFYVTILLCKKAPVFD